MIKLRINVAENAARMEDIGKSYKILATKPGGRNPLARSKRIWGKALILIQVLDK
jgi:hypothetical protein